MRQILPLLLLALLGSALAGCAVAPAGGNGAAADRAILQLRKGQQALSQQLQQTRDNLTMLETRVRDQQKELDRLKSTATTQKVTTGGENAAPQAPSPPQTTVVAPQHGPSPTQIYLKAFADYAAGRFDDSIAGFELFLRLYPDNPYAGNAQYWLGEDYLAQQQYARAAVEFKKVVDTYPQAGKAPEALWKMGTALDKLGQTDKAKAARQLLQQRYPHSAAARRAKHP